jgi:hypothetical protein
MTELRDEIAAQIAAVMGTEMGFSPGSCDKMTTAVSERSEADLDCLWILELDVFGWKVVELRGKPAEEFDPDTSIVEGESVVSHRNIGAWVRSCQEKIRSADLERGEGPPLD